MLIGRPELSDDGDLAYYRVGVEFGGRPDTLWFAVEQTFRDLLTDSADAALVGLLMPAMAAGEKIVIEGSISRRLLFNASHGLQHILGIVNPAMIMVPIEARETHERHPAGGVATGFSGGVDSFHTLIHHHYAATVEPGFRLTHLVFSDVGSHGSGPAAATVATDRYELVAPAAERIGLPFVRVHSNLDSFYEGPVDGPLGFLSTHTLRNGAVALALQEKIGRFLFSAGQATKWLKVAPESELSFFEPIVVPTLSTGALDAVPVGGEFNRAERTLEVAEQPDSYRVLNVCVEPVGGANCSVCEKCLRTQVTLEIAGLLDRYSGVFDRAKYRRMRTWYLGEVLRAKSRYARDVRLFAKESSFRFPLAARLRALSKPIVAPVLRKIRAMTSSRSR